MADSTIDSTKIMEKSDVKSEDDCFKKIDNSQIQGKVIQLVKADSNVSSKKEENEHDGSCGGESSELRSPEEEI